MIFQPGTSEAQTVDHFLNIATTPAHLHSLIPTIVELSTKIRNELNSNLLKLLNLNPSRREAVARYLDLPDPSSLRKWIDELIYPHQNRALQAFFEEVALITLGQAILLKSWSDRGIRTWKEEDLGKLNWALSSILKPHIPLDREGWQLTKPNLYSWYNPGSLLQKEIWHALEAWRITDEGPAFLADVIHLAQQFQPERPELRSYDPRFFSTLWNHMGTFGFDPDSHSGPLKRKKIIFSPTLRDGAMVRTGPASVSWIGLESSPFQLLIAELAQLWWGPASPPVWALGNGLEAHSRDQLSLGLGSPKPSLISRIGEMEACDLALVLEERVLRLNHRFSESSRLKKQLDELPYFKKLRGPSVSLGALQACVALSKLRPGGLLCWAREEPLTSIDGQELLSFLLDRSRLLCEWDLSQVQHTLPGHQPIASQYFYLFMREIDLQKRLSHRPLRLVIQGQIRSHVEMPLILGDAFQGIHAHPEQPRGNWQIHRYLSPASQKEWAERWPDPASHDRLRDLEQLRLASIPLANVATIRSTPHGDPKMNQSWSVPLELKGLWIHIHPEEKRLVAQPLPQREKERVTGSGYLILLSDETWIAPLCTYLESHDVHAWLDYHIERRGDRWHLSEQMVKFIPIPKNLLQALGAHTGDAQPLGGSFAVPLPGEWEKLASEIAYHPKQVLQKLNQIPMDQAKTIRAALFVRSTRALDHLRSGQKKLLSLVDVDGRLKWSELLKILPKQELIQATMHPGIRISGSLPSHLPIVRIEPTKIPISGFLLTSENGFNLHLGSEKPRLLEMLADQFEGLVHPTWSELAQYLRLPRHLELAEATAVDLIRSHGEQTAKIRDLTELISACSHFGS